MADITINSLALKRDDIPQNQWPELSCGGANQLQVNSTINATAFIGDGSLLTGKVSTTGDTITGSLSIQEALTVSGNISVGTTTEPASLTVNGTVTATAFQGNGAALVGKVSTAGDTMTGALTIQNNLTVSGNATISSSLSVSGRLGFGAQMRQMLNLFNEGYGIGVQSQTQYFRADADFAWFRGGTHNDGRHNPGAGGTRLMALNTAGDLILSARTNPKAESSKSLCRALVDYGNKLIINYDNDYSEGVGIGINAPRTALHVLGRISSGADFTSAGAITFFPPDGAAWFHIDNGPAGGRPTGRLRISHGGNPGDNEIVSILQTMNVGIGTSDPKTKLQVVGDLILGNDRPGQKFIFHSRTNGSGDFLHITVDDSAGNWDWGKGLILGRDGNFLVRGRLFVTDLPLADRRNVQWDDVSKQFCYDNSSRKSKENITSLQDDFSKILEIEPKTYTRPTAPEYWEIGYIAEELHELGLSKLVYYDQEGLPEAINYPKVSMYLLEILKHHEQKIEEYAYRIHQLEQHF